MINRRRFLQYVGASAFTLYTKPVFAKTEHKSFLQDFISPPYPIPLPADGGKDTTDPEVFSRFTVTDNLVIPSGYQKTALLSWGEKIGALGHEIEIGYNCDHLSLIPRKNYPGEYFLLVNHEYVSPRPWTLTCQQVTGRTPPPLKIYPGSETTPKKLRLLDMMFPYDRGFPVEKYKELRTAVETLSEMILSEMGVSIVHLRFKEERLEVIKNSALHRRIASNTRSNITAPFKFGGPGSSLLTPPLGTMANCSGATTPWGTGLTCEENIQDAVTERITPEGKSFNPKRWNLGAYKPDKDTGIPLEWTGIGTCLETPLDGRHYGWVAEIDPENGAMTKWTSLGRFRHENITLNVKSGKELRAYMGDDRRGGHIWRYQSADKISDPASESNSRYFEKGTLYVARFSDNFQGEWIPIVPETKLMRPEPEKTALGYLLLPGRPEGGSVVVTNRPPKQVSKSIETFEPKFLTPKFLTIDEWIHEVEKFSGRSFSEITLGDLVRGKSKEETQLILLMDAFLMANACGGTPSARPEDLEVHPFDESIFIAFTDNTGKDDGSPDIRIFPDSLGENSRQYGAVYRIVEGTDPTHFTWGKFISSGEVAESGAAFAEVDNLAFDEDGNLWFVCDISTEVLNFPVERRVDDTAPGKKRFPGIFGNSSMFVVPTSGPHPGIPKLFATGPMESELTGIKFYKDKMIKECLLVSVQHPGELNGIGTGVSEHRKMELLTRKGRKFQQDRIVPLGSSFPEGIPRPTVYVIKPLNA